MTATELQRDVARQAAAAKVSSEKRLQAAEQRDNNHNRQYPLEHHVRPIVQGMLRAKTKNRHFARGGVSVAGCE